MPSRLPKPPKNPFAPGAPSGRTPAPPSSSPKSQPPKGRNPFSLGGRRYNGQSQRRGTRH